MIWIATGSGGGVPSCITTLPDKNMGRVGKEVPGMLLGCVPGKFPGLLGEGVLGFVGMVGPPGPPGPVPGEGGPCWAHNVMLKANPNEQRRTDVRFITSTCLPFIIVRANDAEL